MGLLQIAPAEAPDAKVRMVIITGPPEAQFKVCVVEGTGNWREQDDDVTFPNPCVSVEIPKIRLEPHRIISQP